MPTLHARSFPRHLGLGMAGFLLWIAASASAALVTYPEYPEAIERDWAYDVSVTQGSDTRTLVVYNHSEKSALTTRTRGGDVNRRFCEFAFSGEPVRVDIRVCEDIQSYKVFPSRLGLATAFSNGVISVWLDEPHHFGIELNDYVKTILSVFVDEPEDPADIPSRNDPNVLYVEGWMDPPGPDGLITVSNQYSEVYIAPGAVLNSRLRVINQGVRVHGRGMILDPFSDIFRYDQLNNTASGVVRVGSGANNALLENVKIVDARTYNYVLNANNVTCRNVKAMSAMMCSDGMTSGGKNFAMERAWLYVGDNALVVSGLTNEGRFRDITIGTSCKAIFPQGSNTGVTMENIDVFRCDEALIANVYNPQSTNGLERTESFFFKNLSGVDSTLFARFFLGANMGTLPKTFGFENLAIPYSTGSDNWRTIGKTDGKPIRIYDDAGTTYTTCNYELSITNLWVAGAQSGGFAESEIANPDGVTVTVTNTLATPSFPVVPNRHVVNWTCPWKRYIGDSLQRDVRFATPEAGEQRLAETNLWANLLADRPATRSAWQRSPSYQAKLSATTFEDGARIYRIRNCQAKSGMYNDITDAFLRRGNGHYRLMFDARVVNGPEIPLDATLLSNEKSVVTRFTVPNDGAWHSYDTVITTGFDPAITELVGFSMKSAVAVTEIDFRNLSLTKIPEDTTQTGTLNCRFAYAMEITFPGCAPVGATLTDFPALVRLSTAIPDFRYSDFTLPNGGDLRFFDANGSLVPHEIDTWNEYGESLVWVKVPSLDVNTVLTARYGCIGEPPAVAAKDVWDDGYVGVWHLGESELPMKESSRTTTDFTSMDGTGIVFAVSGAVGGAVDFARGVQSRRLVAQDHYKLDGFTQFTLEAWTFQTNRTGSVGILAKRTNANKDISYFLYDTGSVTAFLLSTNGTTRLEAPTAMNIKPSLNAWTHQAYTFDAGLVSGYKNGTTTGSGTLAAERIYSGSTPLVLGNFDQSDNRNFPGRIDEVRISRVARSAAWLKATYETVMNANFAAYTVRQSAFQHVVASDEAGYDWTNRIVTVEGATAAGETLSLALSALDGTSLGTVTATTDEEGTATFNVETGPGMNYVYTVFHDGEMLASGSFLAGGWDADAAWFLAAPDGQGGSVEVGGAWRLPPDQTTATSYIVNGGTAAFALADDALAEGEEQFVRVETEVVYPSLLEETAVPDVSQELSETIAMIGPMTNRITGGAAKWMAYVDGAWTELACAIKPAVETPFVMRFESDFAIDSPRIRFSVSDDGGATFATLSDAATGAEWLVPMDATRHALTQVLARGTGEIARIHGTHANADVASAGGTGYASLEEALASGNEVTLLTNVTWPTNAPAGQIVVNRGGYSLLLPPDGVSVDGNTVVISAGLCYLGSAGALHVTFADLAAVGVETAGRTPSQIAEDLKADGANGIPKWQSYVLGLDTTVATALPYADIAKDGEMVEVSLGGVEVNESSGATVTYRVYEVEELADFPDGGIESEAVDPDETVLVPTSDSDAKFFRIKITIELP